MNLETFILFLSMPVLFAVNGAVFFRKGQHNAKWFLTVLPFLANAIFVAMFFAGTLSPFVPLDSVAYRVSSGAGAVLCIAAVALFAYTVGSHRVSIPMWHQPNDLPSAVVTWGPYRYVRHPFYSSYYLYFGGLVLVAPAWPILAAACYAFFVLGYTAQVEERELMNSELGEDYRSMLRSTGRFFPPLLSHARQKSGMLR